MPSAKQKSGGGTAATVVSTAVGVYLGNNAHPHIAWVLYVAAALSLIYALLQWPTLLRLLDLQPISDDSVASGISKHQVAATSSTLNRGSQIANSGVAIFGDEAIARLVEAMQAEKPEPVGVAAPQPIYEFKWKYTAERFTVSNGVWRRSSLGWQGISATITSLVPEKGQMGVVHTGLVACVKFWTASENEAGFIDRAYWIGKAENDIEIDSGESASLVLLCLEAVENKFEWVGYSNPYTSEQVQSDWRPTTLQLGRKCAIPVLGAPTIEVKIMNRYSRKVVDSRRLQITISDGIWSAKELP